MKFSWPQPAHSSHRATNVLRASSFNTAESNKPPSLSLSSLFWLLLHGLCCLSSLLLGFRFSRVVFFLLFSTATTTIYTSTTLTTTLTTTTTTTTTLTEASLALPVASYRTATSSPNHTSSHVVVGRHGIRIRPWPHPDPAETQRAHRILELVQREQQRQHSVRSPRKVIVVTPTYVRTFQALHLTGVMHTLMLVPYDLTWIVVEAGEGGGTSRETATIFAKSNLDVLHVPFLQKKMPVEWSDRHRMETRMRLHALRVINERRLDGLVVFADDSNIHSVELFDEIQKVKWMGAVSVGILARSARPSKSNRTKQPTKEENSLPVPIQGPACDASGRLAGWRTFDIEKSTSYPGQKGMVLPSKLEWSGFVVNSRLLWGEAEGKPGWVRNLDDVGKDGEEEIDSPLDLLKDASFVEPLGDCGRKVLLWWLRAEARADSKFPPGWIIEPSLEVIVPSKYT
ncbi:putative glucuronosyltransferase [Iris pallida]|uniref:Glycosyltransferases n=1 Tax=Iris pallida TaxID=29817 RepID=A0AAX6DN30_IRIPA|nr:putative glucuronosyltransferase [Iris pallida]